MQIVFSVFIFYNIQNFLLNIGKLSMHLFVSVISFDLLPA